MMGMRLDRHRDHHELIALSARSKKHHQPREVEQLHGVIVCESSASDERLVVCPKPPYVKDILDSTLESGLSITSPTVPVYDGVTLRIFRYKGDWIVSTATRADARTTSWASRRTFADLMLDAILPKRTCVKEDEQAMQALFNASLNADCIYHVTLLHPDHAWVIWNPRPVLVLTDVYDRVIGAYFGRTSLCDRSKGTPFCAAEELGEEFQAKGVTWTNEDGVRHKVDSAWFTAAQDLRLNRKDIAEAYVHQWPERTADFYQMFPWAHAIFDWWSSAIHGTEDIVTQLYCERATTGQVYKHHPLNAIVEKVYEETKPTHETWFRWIHACQQAVRSWHTLEFMGFVYAQLDSISSNTGGC